MNLSRNEQTRYYYQRAGVVFDIKDTKNGDDVCLINGDGVKEFPFPYIRVQRVEIDDDNKVTEIYEDYKYYLDSLIVVGDTYSSGDSAFTHTIHAKSPNAESGSTYCDYFSGLCKADIGEAILIRNKDYDYFKENLGLLNIPIWMVSGEVSSDKIVYVINASEIENPKYAIKYEPYEKGNFNPIVFNEDLYNELKDNLMVDKLKEQAYNNAKKYGYLIKSISIEIEKEDE